MQLVDTEPTDEEDEFVRLFLEHQTVLRAFIISLMPGCQEVDDIIQDVSVDIWKNRAKFEPNTNFKAWIFTLARFRVLSHWRDSQRNKESAMPEELMHVLADESGENIQLDVIRDQVRALRHCLVNLRQEDRGLVMQRYWQKIPFANLAKDSSRSVNSLKVTLHRIRKQLRDCVSRRLLAHH